jgi:hypothetical protein
VSRFVITSNVRFAPNDQTGGYVRVLDVERGEVTFVSAVPESIYRDVDPNPRGGQRGGRGVSVHGERLVVGNAETMYVFDRSWKLVASMTHRWMANIHDLLAEERGLWVTATACDALLLMSWQGELLGHWTPGEDERLLDELDSPGSGLTQLDAGQDYRDPRLRNRTHTVHINSVSRGRDGALVGFGRVHEYAAGSGIGDSVVVQLDDRVVPLDAAPSSVLLRVPAGSVPNHNAAQDGDLLLVNDSNRNLLVAYDLARGEEVHAVAVPGQPGFARGLAKLAPNLWLVGSQEPLAVYAVDLERGEVVAAYPLGGVPYETVFAICELPDAFDDPHRPDSDDPYAFWKKSASAIGMTPIPARRA